jgi:hypothetical protein
VKRDTVIDPDDESEFITRSLATLDALNVPAFPGDNTLAVAGEDDDVVSGTQTGKPSIVADDLFALALGANYLASVGAGTDFTADHKRRPFSAETATSGKRATSSSQQAASTLVFDEALGIWISTAEAGLLSLIDNELAGSAVQDGLATGATSANRHDGNVLIDWSAQSGVSRLISRYPVR